MKKINTQLVFIILKSIGLLISLLFVNCMVHGFTNFGNIDVAEFISANIKYCNKEEKTNRVIFEMNPNNKNEPFFKNNKQAVAILSNIQKNAVFLTWDTENEEFTSSNATASSVQIYGISSRGNLNTLPFGLKLLAGDYDESVFNSYDLFESDPKIKGVYISQSVCFSLFPNVNADDVIGKRIENANLKEPLTIKGVCANDSILNGYDKEGRFIVGNHLNFSTYYDYERLILKLDDNFNTNYSIFKKLFYSNSWIPPFSEKAYIKLSFVNNEWLESESKIVFNNSSSVPSFLPIVFDILYIPIGFVFFIFLSNYLKRKTISNLPFVCISLFIIMFLNWLSEKIINKQVWFGIHIVGGPVFSLVYSSFGTILLILGFVGAFYYFKYKGKNAVIFKDSYYQIDI